VERARQRYGSTDYKNASGILRDVLVATVNESYEEELATLKAPVVMVWGSNDMDVPVTIAERASALLSSTHSLRVVNGIGHLLPSQAPKELAASINEALK
jgi:pimeloyl-ACP methyl ester carboxylesterase